MNRKLLIVGRSGVGKDTLAGILQKEYGLKMVKSYTTRPKRYENEDTHIFITPEEVKNYPIKVAETNIKGYDYFATKQQVEECDMYIIDPIGLYTLVKRMPETEFIVIYIYADAKQRKEMAMARESDKATAESIYNARNKAEDKQFASFEEKILYGYSFSPNIARNYVINNDYNAQQFETTVKNMYENILAY